MKKRLLAFVLVCICLLRLHAQQYTGLSGLIHIPTAEMNKTGDACIGAHFLNKYFTPDGGFVYENEKYNTLCYYLSITPFSWIELGYTCTLIRKFNAPNTKYHGAKTKDRYFSVKLNPLKERKWIPAIVIGCNDVSDSFSLFNTNDDAVESYFGNYYIAASKHFNIWKGELGTHLAYRYYIRAFNRKWNGVVGGITYRPSFAKNLRAMVEYAGEDINIGVDCLLWKHLFLQASLQDGKHFTGGACFKINLLGKKKQDRKERKSNL